MANHAYIYFNQEPSVNDIVSVIISKIKEFGMPFELSLTEDEKSGEYTIALVDSNEPVNALRRMTMWYNKKSDYSHELESGEIVTEFIGPCLDIRHGHGTELYWYFENIFGTALDESFEIKMFVDCNGKYEHRKFDSFIDYLDKRFSYSVNFKDYLISECLEEVKQMPVRYHHFLEVKGE